MDFSEKLKALRQQNKLTLQELAKKSGLGIATLSRLENGSRKGTLRTHQKICDALDIKLVDMFKETESYEEDINFSEWKTFHKNLDLSLIVEFLLLSITKQLRIRYLEFHHKFRIHQNTIS